MVTSRSLGFLKQTNDLQGYFEFFMRKSRAKQMAYASLGTSRLSDLGPAMLALSIVVTAVNRLDRLARGLD